MPRPGTGRERSQRHRALRLLAKEDVTGPDARRTTFGFVPPEGGLEDLTGALQAHIGEIDEVAA